MRKNILTMISIIAYLGMIFSCGWLLLNIIGCSMGMSFNWMSCIFLAISVAVCYVAAVIDELSDGKGNVCK